MKEAKTGAEMAKAMADFVNPMSYDKKGFIEEMGNRTHRTLQQAFTGLCLEWLKHLASLPQGQYDLRNEYSVKLAKEIMTKVPDAKYGVPTI
jgi:hypothetical protein